MRPLVMLTIPVRTSRGYRVHTLLCRSSGCRCSSSSLLIMCMMLPLPGLSCSGLWICIIFALGSSIWMLAIGVCNSSAGSMVSWEPWSSCPGIPSAQCEPLLPPSDLDRSRVRQAYFHQTFRGAGCSSFFTGSAPPLSGWSAIVMRVALTYTATIIVGLAAQQAGRASSHPLA
jgi:hypothetical protein